METPVITIAREGEAAIAVINRTTGAKLTLPRWSVALAFGQSLAYQARGLYDADALTVSGVTLRRDDAAEVEVISVDPTVWAVLPLGYALAIANLVIGVAREIETEDNWEEIVFDQAILDRSNLLPQLGLVRDPYLLNEAKKEAAWNSDLRRYLPGGVRRQRKVSTPKVDKELQGE